MEEALTPQGVKPSLGLQFLSDCGWLRFYPELAALQGCEQDPIWHPEGDVWTHTLHCLDWFALERTGNHDDDLIAGLGILCHDFGKPATTTTDLGRITSRALITRAARQNPLTDSLPAPGYWSAHSDWKLKTGPPPRLSWAAIYWNWESSQALIWTG